MEDLFFEIIKLQRIHLVSRLATSGHCNEADRELALEWIAEMLTALMIDMAKNRQIEGLPATRGE